MPEKKTAIEHREGEERMTELKGRELDAAVAEKVMGFSGRVTFYAWADRKKKACPLVGFEHEPQGARWNRRECGTVTGENGEKIGFHPLTVKGYSSSWEAAAEVIEKMRERFRRVEVIAAADGYAVQIEAGTSEVDEHYIAEAVADTAPEAICRAALAAMASMEEGKENT